MPTMSVHAAPSEYILQEGSLQLLEDKLKERSLKKVLVVTGKKSWEAAEPFWPHLNHDIYQYNGNCSLSEVQNVSELVERQQYDGVIGVGGGKVLDIVKAVCHETAVQAILVPTLASNCASWTPLSVLYNEEGLFVRFQIYPVAASLVLVEPAILLSAPLDLFIAGIGDTIAKWYEADIQMSVLEQKTVPLQISYHAAKQCRDLLLECAEAAIQAVRSGKMNADFIKATETIIMYAGMVGGYGDHYGRVAGAHSIHNGMTVIKETHEALHGAKVAYGILVQLALEEKWVEVEQLVPFYKKIGLPLSLKQLGLTEVKDSSIERISLKATEETESIHAMPIGPINAERVSAAIKSVEARFAEQKSF